MFEIDFQIIVLSAIGASDIGTIEQVLPNYNYQ